MSIKGKLIGAIVDGVGLSAGRDLYEQAKKKIADELREENPEEVALREKEEARAAAAADEERVAEEKRRAKERAQAAKAAKAEAARKEKAIDRELAALKKQLGK
jgi:hypothetical protein